jgi:molecular chaperone Hsp33
MLRKGGRTMLDYVVRATALAKHVRAFAAVTTNLVEEIRRRQHASPTATAAIGRAATIGAMMGTMLKGDERLMIQIQGGGPIGTIVVDADAHGHVRAYATRPGADMPPNDRGKFDVAGVVGTNGFLYVTKDLGMKEPYRGSVRLVSGEIAEDFAEYFTRSEQTRSAVGAGVLYEKEGTVRMAGGFILQLLPGVREEEIAEIEDKLHSLPPLTAYLADGATPEELLQRLLPGDVHVHEKIPVVFRCTCSAQRIENGLVSLGREELESLCREQGGAEAVCNFCGEVYVFSREDLERLISVASGSWHENDGEQT